MAARTAKQADTFGRACGILVQAQCTAPALGVMRILGMSGFDGHVSGKFAGRGAGTQSRKTTGKTTTADKQFAPALAA